MPYVSFLFLFKKMCSWKLNIFAGYSFLADPVPDQDPEPPIFEGRIRSNMDRIRHHNTPPPPYAEGRGALNDPLYFTQPNCQSLA
jgi:hypothetical protein